MTVKEILDFVRQRLQAEGFENSYFEGQWLVSGFLEMTSSELLQKSEQEVDPNEVEIIKEATVRRLSGRPLAYILQSSSFFGREFFVDEGVLIPRPETELLVELALNMVHEKFVAVDLGAGSGCIGISLALERPDSQVILVERSSKAAEVLLKNLEKFRCDSRVKVVRSDVLRLFEESKEIRNLRGSCQLVSANPPYIAKDSQGVAKDVQDNEPHEALFAGPVGTEDVFAWSDIAEKLLAPQGVFVCEIGYNQGSEVVNYLNQKGFWKQVVCHQDQNGRDRIVAAIKE